MAKSIRYKPLWNLLPGLMLVMLMAVITAYLLPRSHINYIGADTARIKTVYTYMGYPITEGYRDTTLTSVLRKYLGPLPTETHWVRMNELGEGIIGIKASGWGEHIYMQSQELATLIDRGKCNINGQRMYEMTKESKCFALRNYVASVKISDHGDWVFGMYASRLQQAIEFLDHPALPQDIPPLEEATNEELWKSKWEPRIDELTENWKANHAGSSP